MKKRIIETTVILAGLLFIIISCQRDDFSWQEKVVPEGYVALSFEANFPSMPTVETRGVDPDGIGIQNMTLFCFDAYGLFITTAKADPMTKESDEKGSFDAVIPANTKRIHFFANQNMSSFSESHFRNKSESEVMSVLEGSAGMMIYWGRIACPTENEKIEEQIPSDGVTLYRNQAKITISDWEDNGYLVVTGFAVYNTNAFGTVAPYNPNEKGDARWEWPGTSPYVTLPVDQSKLSDIVEVQTSAEQYIFECENDADSPLSVIIRGHNPGETETADKYYRVMLVDEQGEQVLIRRNFHYQLNIAGTLAYGQDSFEAALSAPATNNVWLSIGDEVDEVEDNDFILRVDETNYVFPAPTGSGTNQVKVSYTLKSKGSNSLADADKPTVTWLEGNTVAQNSFRENSFDINGKVGTGTIGLTLLPLNDNEQKREGTLLVKKGRLQRKIKVITVREQEFVPAWASAQVNGDMTGTGGKIEGAHATVMFTIPESCPAELFPMRVLIAVNNLDVRSESGMDLPVVFKGEEGYGEVRSEDYGYKYVYTVEKVGVQRVYFENILDEEENERIPVIIEAEFFKTMEKEFVFTTHNREITVEGLEKYTKIPGDGFPDDEAIFYRLVPQKINAQVQFDMVMKEGGNSINANEKDEFVLYAQNLTYYKDGETWDGVDEFDCEFYAGEWMNETGGRMMAFRPRKDKLNATPTGEYSIYMKTTKAESAEVVRIASNQSGEKSVWNSSSNYAGNTYRSVTFELANYNPFRFHATVGGEGEKDFVVSDVEDNSTAAEKVTSLEWTYEPDGQVDIAFDVTSFRGTDKKSADPFGTEFDIYIDAPMLEIDQTRIDNLASKLKSDPNVEGRFIYTVEAKRNEERQYSSDHALKRDATGVNQDGERKVLPFKKKDIVSAGNIVISSNKKQVVFFDKTFKVINTPIEGTIQLTEMNPDTPGFPGTGLQDIPKDGFVIFEWVSNGSRIGSMTITSNGKYELRLRKEYKFEWRAGKVELHYTNTQNGKVYHCEVESLAKLFESPNLILYPAQ